MKSRIQARSASAGGRDSMRRGAASANCWTSRRYTASTDPSVYRAEVSSVYSCFVPLAILRRAEAAHLRLLNLERTDVQIFWSRIHHRRGAGRRKPERQARAGDRRIGGLGRGDGARAGGARRRSGRGGAQSGEGEGSDRAGARG